MTTAYSNPNPYQYLGCDVSDITDIDEMLMAGGADFDCELRPIGVGLVPTPDANGDVPDLDASNFLVASVASDYVAATRTDTGEVFAIHKRGYVDVAYREVLVSALEACEEAGIAAPVQTCGVIDNGAQFYASLLVDTFALDPHGVNDAINTYLNVFSSHDGTLGIMYAFASFRTICANQAGAIASQGTFKLSAKHTTNVRDRVDLGLRAFALAADATQVFNGEAMKLQAKPSSTSEVLRTFEKFYGKPSDKPEGRGRTRLENTRDAILDIYKGDTCRGAVGDTRWAEFNAFTEYLDHHRVSGGENDPNETMAKAAILPGGWVADKKREIGRYLLAA